MAAHYQDLPSMQRIFKIMAESTHLNLHLVVSRFSSLFTIIREAPACHLQKWFHMRHQDVNLPWNSYLTQVEKIKSSNVFFHPGRSSQLKQALVTKSNFCSRSVKGADLSSSKRRPRSLLALKKFFEFPPSRLVP